jgi:hypothetical protein
MGGLDGIVPELASRFMAAQAAAAAAGYTLGVTSGYRDINQQISLRSRNGCPDTWNAPANQCRVPTARPGTSNHEKGLAIDVSGSPEAKQWLAQHAAEFGLGLPVEGEDWHVEMLGDNRSMGYAQAAQQMGAIGFDVTWADQQRDPMETVDERIQTIMGAITGAQRDALALSTPSGMLQTPQLREDVTTIPGDPALRTERTTLMPGVPAAGASWQDGIPPPGYVPEGKGVERWRDTALAALAYTGQDPAYVDLMLRRMNQESGGNPTIVNDWDSNAARGDPSVGLMQNIISAFPERAKELAPRGITDGFANMVASIRYTLGRYGSLSAWGRKGGY